MMKIVGDSGLRYLDATDVPRFCRWEKEERPYPWAEPHFLESLTSSVQNTLVLERQGNQVVGFATIQVIAEEAHLLNFMIDPAQRKQRNGTDLMRRILMWAKKKGASKMTLDVDPDNVAAVELYKKAGFQIIERRSGAYPRGESAFIMKMELR